MNNDLEHCDTELAWVSGFSGEKGKDGSKKGRELPQLKSPLP